MGIKRTAIFDLYLHGGKAPRWLVSRMKKLGEAIFSILLHEYDRKEVLARLSDPLWFQSLAYVLGYDWDSSGVTTVLTGVLKSIFTPETGLMIAGGKGNKATQAPQEILKISEIFGFGEKKTRNLINTSRLVAKVDNALIQDNHQLYHHAMIIDEDGNWAVIQQGMNVELKTARRYHWCSSNVKSFVIDPHTGIIGNIRFPFVLNMASKDSVEGQKVSLDLVNDGPSVIKRDLSYLIRKARGMMDLTSFFNNSVYEQSIYCDEKMRVIRLKILRSKINWKALNKAYEISPKSYEDLILIRGIGPGTVRALALIAELIYHADISWRDPLRYTFAVGGKDGVPYPVNTKRMERVAKFLQEAIEEAHIGKNEKLDLLKRLSRISSRI